MFERFSTRAQLVVFAARHYATQLSSPEMGTEHLLLGILHYEPSFFTRETAAFLRQRANEVAVRGLPVKLTDDMPMTKEARDVLALADQLTGRCVDVRDLLWALAKDRDTSAGRILREAGFSLLGGDGLLEFKPLA